MDTKATGALIAARRKRMALSQAELAERLHVTDKAVSRWETGRGMPGLDSLEPLAEALGLSVSELLSGKELTTEELPKAADAQIVESMRNAARMAFRGALAVLLAAAVLAAGWLGFHYFTTAAEADEGALTRQAAGYLGRLPARLEETGDRSRGQFDYQSLQIVKTARRGNYLAALCSDEAGHWCMCEYDRDSIFSDRWRANGGSLEIRPGRLASWNFGFGGDAVMIFSGADLPEEAAWYTFQHDGITYLCPIEDRQVLDIFLVTDTWNITPHSLTLLDEGQRPLN